MSITYIYMSRGYSSCSEDRILCSVIFYCILKYFNAKKCLIILFINTMYIIKYIVLFDSSTTIRIFIHFEYNKYSLYYNFDVWSNQEC